jgi:hypothetical protein
MFYLSAKKTAVTTREITTTGSKLEPVEKFLPSADWDGER